MQMQFMKNFMRMPLKDLRDKRGVMGQVVSVFILVLVISVIVGMTFLFTAQLKENVEDTATGGTNSTAYKAVNKTEKAGSDLVDYLPLVFLALIFGAILIVVLRVILPYLNIGRGF